MQIPVLNGIYTNAVGEFRTAYPRNMVPVPKGTGISEGYLAPAEGLKQLGTLPGPVRGAIVRNNTIYAVAGNSLVSISSGAAVTTIGTIPGAGRVSMDYSFAYLAIATGGDLYLTTPSSVTQVTDVDLGTVLDVVFVDGYFMTTDGTNLIVNELDDPFAINPLKYGSVETDPDPVKAVLKVRNEVHAIGRHTIEVFDNIGGPTFPFQRIEGARIGRGAIGTHACCVYQRDTVAFLGGGPEEQTAVWVGANGQSVKISTREIDQILAGYSEAQLANARLYERAFNSHSLLLIDLPDQTLCYDAAATKVVGSPVWFSLTSSVIGLGQYRGAYPVFAYNQWWAFDTLTGGFGTMERDESEHWGASVGWDFGTTILYNEGHGALIHELEVVCLPGRVTVGDNPTIWMQYSRDGQSWSVERPVLAGVAGQTQKRIVWHQCGNMRQWRTHRFRGSGGCRVAVSAVEARIEGLAY